jgi:hypothetical protein
VEERDNPYAAPEAPSDPRQKPRAAPEPRTPLTDLEKAAIAGGVAVLVIGLLAWGHGVYVAFFQGD